MSKSTQTPYLAVHMAQADPARTLQRSPMPLRWVQPRRSAMARVPRIWRAWMTVALLPILTAVVIVMTWTILRKGL